MKADAVKIMYGIKGPLRENSTRSVIPMKRLKLQSTLRAAHPDRFLPDKAIDLVTKRRAREVASDHASGDLADIQKRIKSSCTAWRTLSRTTSSRSALLSDEERKERENMRQLPRSTTSTTPPPAW